jgi:RNA polymerase sigma-70 factor, ECF subfamily
MATECFERIEAEIPRLRRYARLLLRGRVDAADDLVEAALRRRLAQLHHGSSGTSLRAELFSLLHRCYAESRGRWARRRPAIEVARLRPGMMPSSGGDLQALHRAIDCLSEEMRTTLLLIGLEGFRCEETAQILRIPLGTVRTRLGRAREELRALIDDRTCQGRSRADHRPSSATNIVTLKNERLLP